MTQYSKYVGLDVHKDTISVAVAEGEQPAYYGEIPNHPEAISRLLKRLNPHGEVLSCCYEAGPCGYTLYRQVKASGHECQVVAPSLIPRKPGDRVKTDRRDAINLARLHRSGELTPVWVPDEEQEAIRDLTRARWDMKTTERQARQRLSGFLLRHGKKYGGQSKWTQAHFHWLEKVRFEHPVQQIVFQEYVDAVLQAQERVAGLVKEMERALAGWSLKPVVEGLMALRGINLITAMTTIAELGDLTRFDSPRQLMAYLGLVPSEASSGKKCHRGGITKTGNRHVRRLLIEAAWCYRFPARKTAHLQRKGKKTSEAVQSIAWIGQKRLCGRYRHLRLKGKLKVIACAAIARELCGFIWAVANEVTNPSAFCTPKV